MAEAYGSTDTSWSGDVGFTRSSPRCTALPSHSRKTFCHHSLFAGSNLWDNADAEHRINLD